MLARTESGSFIVPSWLTRAIVPLLLTILGIAVLTGFRMESRIASLETGQAQMTIEVREGSVERAKQYDALSAKIDRLLVEVGQLQGRVGYMKGD